MTDTFSNTDPFTAANAGGGGGAAIKFAEVGDEVTGIVREVSERNDTDIAGNVKTWPSGDPVKMWVFTLDVDGEHRSLFVRGNMVKAIREATTAAGVPTLIGQRLTVKHHALGDKRPGMTQAKLFKAKIEPAPAAVTSPADEPW